MRQYCKHLFQKLIAFISLHAGENINLDSAIFGMCKYAIKDTDDVLIIKDNLHYPY